jgi:hypothetical protein
MGVDWKQPGWGNCRIEENELVKKRYLQGLSNRKYVHL